MFQEQCLVLQFPSNTFFLVGKENIIFSNEIMSNFQFHFNWPKFFSSFCFLFSSFLVSINWGPYTCDGVLSKKFSNLLSYRTPPVDCFLNSSQNINFQNLLTSTQNHFLKKQQQLPEVFYEKRCTQKFHKIHRKTPVPESPF